MLHKEFFGLIFLGFVFWIIAATTPGQRIENACRPVGWTGSVITSMSALVLPSQQGTVQGWFDKVEYGCRYTAWRLFYQDAYNKWKASNPTPRPVTPPTTEGATPVETPTTPSTDANKSAEPAAAVAPATTPALPVDEERAVAPPVAK
jgi:hypothetical protein